MKVKLPAVIQPCIYTVTTGITGEFLSFAEVCFAVEHLARTALRTAFVAI